MNDFTVQTDGIRLILLNFKNIQEFDNGYESPASDVQLPFFAVYGNVHGQPPLSAVCHTIYNK
jgi:hypothetical protein